MNERLGTVMSVTLTKTSLVRSVLDLTGPDLTGLVPKLKLLIQIIFKILFLIFL